VSERTIRRAQQRRLAAERRREALRRRRGGLAAGAAIGATALFAPAAQAAPFEVNTLADAAADACDSSCTLRDAVAAADAAAGADTVTFASGLSGRIRLTNGEIPIGSGDALSISGPGAGTLTVSGDADNNGGISAGDSRIFDITSTPVAISGLTLTNGYSPNDGGALYADSADLTIANSAITGSESGDDGGGLSATGTSHLTISGTTFSGNSAPSGYGGGLAARTVTISRSAFVGNDAGIAGGLASQSLDLDSSSVRNNQATSAAAGIFAVGRSVIHDSEITGNASAGVAGGVLELPYQNSEIRNTTISGNASTGNGAGLYVGDLLYGADLTLSHSTISGNSTGTGSSGGGIMLPGAVYGPASGPLGDLDVVDSTISGNSAGTGAGASFGTPAENEITRNSTIDLDSSTIASNTAGDKGGGLYLGQYSSPTAPTGKTSPTIGLSSTIVGDNTAAGSPQDLDRLNSSSGGGFDLAFSLVEAPGDAPLFEDPGAPSIVGSDPQLAPLADNGGSTKTQLPARTSPAIDQGNAASRIVTDQRDLARIVDLDRPNATGGDGSDIGAVELGLLPAPPPPPEPPAPPPASPPQDLSPAAVIKHNGLRSKEASKRRVSGTARDDHRVAKVEVALVYKTGGDCRELLASGRFSARHRCRRPRLFVKAKGTRRWSFTLSHRLKRGYYVVYSRATDDAGHTQLLFGTKSRRPFRVR
jgi:CSLREA domain-containing protein